MPYTGSLAAQVQGATPSGRVVLRLSIRIRSLQGHSVSALVLVVAATSYNYCLQAIESRGTHAMPYKMSLVAAPW